ncbi:unnamed protein product [Paramecium primaurelia]|uniref:Uncharacterized protein n=1 Tax=Paramecium primaurelia TaxID=5886 RepID=A0A8S1NJQ8_PARPR|nr:unnamed protein product [Paramecium primaurelia]
MLKLNSIKLKILESYFMRRQMFQKAKTEKIIGNLNIIIKRII